MNIIANAKGSRTIEVTDQHMETLRRYALLSNLVDSNGIIDEIVVEKLKFNCRAILESQTEVDRQLLDLCLDVVYHTDMKAIVKVLTAAGYKKAQIMKPQELIGVTEMTKLLTKKTFEELLGDYLEKPQGKPTLAPVSDKRPEFKPAEEFTNLDEEKE